MTRRLAAFWLDGAANRRTFERDAARTHPTLRGQHSQDGFRYTLTLEVPGYNELRSVRIEFVGNTPVVHVDGPTDSPHRYSNSSLCMWFPGDGVDRRWCIDDGLPELLHCMQNHLFRECWFRETGEWLGEEAPHEVEA